ncbi:bcl-2/adenovirus E1B 19 kDa-interacting protein 2-like protein isoform 2-T2 [Synchiropus picturatus]
MDTADRTVGDSGRLDMEDLELKEEWQDDGFPRPLPEDGGRPAAGAGSGRAPPTSLDLSGEGGARKKRLVAPSLSLTLSRGDSHDPSTDGFSAAALSASPEEGLSLDINLEALETPSDSETEPLPETTHELEWEDDFPRMSSSTVEGATGRTEYSEMGLVELDQVDGKGRRWRKFCVSGLEYHVDMSVLEPYLQVLSHGGQRSRRIGTGQRLNQLGFGSSEPQSDVNRFGLCTGHVRGNWPVIGPAGYYGDDMNAIILFTSCYLPENTVEDYDYVMDNLFRLKKDLKGLLVVHPAWYIRALITMVKPFISDKFSRKIHFVHSLQELSQMIPTDRLQIPDAIRQFDAAR